MDIVSYPTMRARNAIKLESSPLNTINERGPSGERAAEEETTATAPRRKDAEGRAGWVLLSKESCLLLVHGLRARK